jgi:hypothetical protein
MKYKQALKVRFQTQVRTSRMNRKYKTNASYSHAKEMVNIDNTIYEERISSSRTEALFISFTIIFFLLTIRQIRTSGLSILGAVFLFIFIFFFFYSTNYRILIIRITNEALKLKFGVFTWTVPLDNISGCRYDDLPILMKYGGAGIHFMMIRRRYRASFNFLEHPRVVITLKKKAGLVRDISFSTGRPDEVIALLQQIQNPSRHTSRDEQDY